ncbi:MAG TPA: 2'-5' RNA ligase family protein [Gemmatimonadaceae bacterium]|nr:2'-5' RNA ligase family protein [Gemmatimonadaceae bacterium]
MPTLAGIFILGELSGPVAEEIHTITRRYDPKLARVRRPHVTLAGSSGVGPIPVDTPVAELRERLTPVAAAMPPIELTLQPAHRFTQTDIIVLPIDPYGPIRVLHDRISTSGLRFGPARFTFSPHVTLNLYKSLTRETLRELLQVRVPGSVMLDTLHVYYTSEPRPAKLILDLPLTG